MTNEGSLSPDDWEKIFSTVPPYPTDLPDDLRRALAGLAISVREAAQQMEKGRRAGDLLTFNMPLSLISSGLKKLENYAP